MKWLSADSAGRRTSWRETAGGSQPSTGRVGAQSQTFQLSMKGELNSMVESITPSSLFHDGGTPLRQDGPRQIFRRLLVPLLSLKLLEADGSSHAMEVHPVSTPSTRFVD
jgi:hypothetical protein